MMRAAVVLLGLLIAGCGGKRDSVSYADDEITALDSVGWLGAEVQPLTKGLTVPLDDEELVPGGVVVRALDPGEPLEAAGLRTGDVIVRVGEDWMPLKRDMHLDFVRLVEQGVSAGQKEIDLSLWRGGRLETVQLKCDQTPIETGLPVDVQRFERNAARALQTVRVEEASPGSWAWIAFAAMAADDESSTVGEQAGTKLRARLEDDDASPREIAWGLLLAAEAIGPLPAAYILGAQPAGGSSPAGAPPMGMPAAPDGAVGMTPDKLRALMEKLKAAGAEIKVSGPGGMPPGVLPGGGQDDEPAGAPGGVRSEEPSQAKDAPPAPDSAALIAQHDPARLPKLKPLNALAQRLSRLQQEDGGWSASSGGTSDVESTSHALWSLGATLRVGGTAPDEAIEKGLQYLRKALNEGRLSIEVAKGADRRVEAGRAALAAVALRSLGCPDTDPMLIELWKFSDRFGAEVPDAGREQTRYLVATAVGRRARGLATWSSFYNDFRIRLIAAQRPDGSFLPFEANEDAQRATAAGALLLSLQKERVPVSLAKAENPLAPRWDSEGKKLDVVAPPPAPAGAANAPPADVLKMLEGLGLKPPPGGK